METENLELEQSQLKNAYDMLDNKTRDALEQSYQRINAKLITNKESYFKQSSEIERLIKQLGVSISYA